MFYVYVYLREDGSPYYVGKGKGKRWKRRHNVEVPPEERVLFFITDTTNEWACFLEMWLIAFWGRLNDGTGILENLTDGGETTLGWEPTEETKDKIKKALTGRRLTEAHKRKVSDGLRGRKHKPETIQKMRKPKSEEHKKKIAEAHRGKKSPLKGRKQSEELVKKRAASLKGIKRTEEYKRKMSESKRGTLVSGETKQKLSEMRKGNKWWNNGEEERCCKECPGDGWIRGRRRASK